MSYLLAAVMVFPTTVPVLDAARRRGAFADPVFYFLVSIYVYATFGYLTHLVYAFGDFDFIIPVIEASVHVSYLYSACAVFAIYIGGGLYKPAELDDPERYRSTPHQRTLVAFAAAVCALALASNLYYFYDFIAANGGFDRAGLIDEFGSRSGFALPYVTMLLAALPILALYERWPFSWGVLALFALLHLPMGDRRVVLAALIVILAAKLLRGMRVKKGTLALVLAVVLVVGVVVGVTRNNGLLLALELNTMQAYLVQVFLALSEFARPFATLLYYTDNGYTLLYGRGFAEAVANVVPGFVSPFGKFTSPGQEFREIAGGLGLFQGRVPGYGFFPVTEALLNFGPLGIPVFFLLFAALVRRLSRAAVDWGYAFVPPVLCSATFAFGRSSFSDVFVTYFWVIVFGVALYLAAGLAVRLAGRFRGRKEAGLTKG